MAGQQHGKEVSDTLETAQKTGNPLFLWGALFRLLEAHAETKEDGSLTVRTDVTIPPAIADYLLLASFNLQLLGWGDEPVEAVTKNWGIDLPGIGDKPLTTTKARNQVIKALGLSYGTQGGGPFKEMQTLAKAHCAYALSESLQNSGLSKNEAEARIMTMFNVDGRGVKELIRRGERTTKGDFEPLKGSSKK